jgi:all-trans-8'-apo-beta-carotenal 15,15'-oxygenase
MSLSRRHLLSAFAATGALAVAPAAFATEPSWGLGLENAPADGFADAPMRLVRGRAPAGLEGSLYRNGPGWFRYLGSATGHWFDGDGFIQRFAIADGRARHRAAFADTHKRRIEMARQAIVMPGFGTRGAPGAPMQNNDSLNAANTSVMMVGDELWALWEGGSPTRLDPSTLATHGIRPLRDDLAATPFLAHPKVEPGGRIWNLGFLRNRGVIWRLSADGRVEDAQVLDVGQPSYVHDWAVTERYLIIPLQPWMHERLVAPLVEGFVWRGDQPFRVLVLDKNDYANRRVYELPPMFFFHTGDAWEEQDGTLRFDLCVTPDAEFVTRQARSMIASGDAESPHAELVMAVLHPDGRAEVQRTGLRGEFPQTDRRRQGLRRDLVAVVDDSDGRKLRLMNWSSGENEAFDFGPSQMVQEHLFVPKQGGAGERDAWLIGITLNTRARATELHVFDAARIGDGPVATWRSRHAAPFSFHGTWAPRG